MKPFLVTEDIVPLGKFKTNASRFLRRLRESKRPFVITQHGKAAAVLITPEEFDRLCEYSRFLDAVDEGLADSRAGRVIDDGELTGELDATFGGQEE